MIPDKTHHRKPKLRTAAILAAFFFAPALLLLTSGRLRPVPLHLIILWLAGLLAWLWLRGQVPQKRLWGKPAPGWWRGPVLRCGIFGLAAAAYALLSEPGAAFAFVRDRPGFWLLVMVLYPLLSVLPQELIYRVFLLEILAPQGQSGPVWPAVLISAALFGWVHVIYVGYVALLSTGLAGLVLGWSYGRRRGSPGAVWPVLLEHSLYGQIVFSVGLGHYFYLLRSGF